MSAMGVLLAMLLALAAGSALVVALRGLPRHAHGWAALLGSGWLLARERAEYGGVLRTGDGRIALCELVYKKDWDLPGGVVADLIAPAEPETTE